MYLVGFPGPKSVWGEIVTSRDLKLGCRLVGDPNRLADWPGTQSNLSKLVTWTPVVAGVNLKLDCWLAPNWLEQMWIYIDGWAEPKSGWSKLVTSRS